MIPTTDEAWQQVKESPPYKAFMKVNTLPCYEVLTDLVRLAFNWEPPTMTRLPDRLPDPTGEFYDWVADMARLPPDQWITIHAYQEAATAKGEAAVILHMVAISDMVSRGRVNNLLDLSSYVLEGDTESIHHYRMSEGARAFWLNGFKSNIDNEKILKGWRALQGIAKDIQRGEDDDDE